MSDTVTPLGMTAHEPGDETLRRLASVIDERRQGDPQFSYVARMFAKGRDALLKKVGEEATEVVMAAKDGDPQRVVSEVADLWFHTLLVLREQGVSPEQVLAELRRREGQSGLEEFAARKMQQREEQEK